MSRPQKQPIQRCWCPYATAASQYLGISPDILLGAIKARQLKAYEKPITRGRNPDATRAYHSWWVNLSDVDEWIRAYWPEAFPSEPIPS